MVTKPARCMLANEVLWPPTGGTQVSVITSPEASALRAQESALRAAASCFGQGARHAQPGAFVALPAQAARDHRVGVKGGECGPSVSTGERFNPLVHE